MGRWMDMWMDGQMNEWTGRWMDEWTRRMDIPCCTVALTPPMADGSNKDSDQSGLWRLSWYLLLQQSVYP